MSGYLSNLIFFGGQAIAISRDTDNGSATRWSRLSIYQIMSDKLAVSEFSAYNGGWIVVVIGVEMGGNWESVSYSVELISLELCPP